MTYCKSDNIYEQGVCDGYIISVSDVLYTLDKKTTPSYVSPKTRQLKINSIYQLSDFIIDNAQLMSIEANKIDWTIFCK